MLIRRALALSALALATALAGDTVPGPVFQFRSPVLRPVSLGLTGEKRPAPPPPPSPANAQVITLHDAISMALKHDIDIQWYKTDLKLQDAEIRLAWGAFDPAFAFNSSYTYSQTPENPTIISSADTAQQILLEQQAIAEIQAAAAPTPVPLPSTNPTPSPTPGLTVSNAPYIFQNSDFISTADVQGTSPLGTTYKLGVQVDHLNDTVLGLNGQQFLPSNVFFAGLSIDQPLLQGFGFDANLTSVRIGRRNREVSYNNWRQRIIDSVAIVMNSYFDMNYSEQLMRLRQESKDADSTLAEANQRRVDVGLMTPIDVRQAQVEVSADQYDFLTAKNFQTARVADLKKLIYRGVEDDDGRTFVSAGPVDMPVPALDREALLADAFQNRVDYATAIQQSEIEDLRLKYYQQPIPPKDRHRRHRSASTASTLAAPSAASTALSTARAPSEWSASRAPSPSATSPAAPISPPPIASGRKPSGSSNKSNSQSPRTLTPPSAPSRPTSSASSPPARPATRRRSRPHAKPPHRGRPGHPPIDLLDNRRRLYDAQSASPRRH